MAKPFVNSSTIFIVVLNCLFHTCGSSSVAPLNYQISEKFGQNLTDLIDKVLRDDNNSLSKKELKEALKWSPIVYYETDILLDDIEEIVPVIDLLDNLKPDNFSHPRIILSLNYLNKSNGHFLWNRMEDVYFNLNTNISAPNKSKIVCSVVSIITNFVSPIYWNSYYSSGYCPSKVIFTNFIKEFVNLNFGKNLIPVGLIYTESFPYGCQPQNSFPVDDLIYHMEIEVTQNFPIFIDQFSKYMDKALANIQRNATIFVKSKALLSDKYRWRSNSFGLDISPTIKKAAYATMQNQNITQKFTTKLYQTAGSLLNYMLLSWASLKGRNLIFGNVMHNASGETFTKNPSRRKLLLPFINMLYALEDVCDDDFIVSEISTGFETVLLDEQTWRTLASYHVRQEDNFHICNGSHPRPQTEYLKVLMHVTDETAMNWIHMEKVINRLLVAYPKIGYIHLDTIIFKEDHLKTSTNIQNFVNSKELKYKLGCSIGFGKIESALYEASYGDNVSENDFKTKLGNNLCQPVFHLVSVMVWLAPDYVKTGELFSYYSDLFLAREIFMAHFPNITVLIQFSPSLNTDRQILADLYDVPIVIPSNEILIKN